MNLEPVITYRVIQFRKKKQQSYLFYIIYISYIYIFVPYIYIYITHIWNIEKWYYLQGKKRDTEDRLMDTAGEGEGGTNWEHGAETYRLLRVNEPANGNLLSDARSSAWCSVTAWRVGWGGRGGRFKREGTCVYLATRNGHLPRALPATEQGHPSPASVLSQPCAAAVADLQHPLRDFRVEWATLCSRESDGAGLY